MRTRAPNPEAERDRSMAPGRAAMRAGQRIRRPARRVTADRRPRHRLAPGVEGVDVVDFAERGSSTPTACAIRVGEPLAWCPPRPRAAPATAQRRGTVCRPARSRRRRRVGGRGPAAPGVVHPADLHEARRARAAGGRHRSQPYLKEWGGRDRVGGRPRPIASAQVRGSRSPATGLEGELAFPPPR